MGYSCGNDSTALLSALGEALPEIAAGERPEMLAVYVNHRLRPDDELAAERRIARSVAASSGVALVTVAVRKGAILEEAERSGEGIEAAARRFRYAAFAKVARERSGGRRVVVCLAHHRDDQLETILMRFLGGAATGGTGGMRPGRKARGFDIIRPFLRIPKSELAAYVTGKGIPVSSDSTNLEEDQLRNRVRSRLVPLLDDIYPSWRSSVISGAATRNGEARILRRAARKAITAISGRSATIDVAKLRALPDLLAINAIVTASATITGSRRFPSAFARETLRALMRRLGSGAPKSDIVASGAGVVARLRDGRLELRRIEAERPDFVPAIVPAEGGSVGSGSDTVAVASLVRDVADGLAPGTFTPPLVLRSPGKGDRIALREGHKSVDSILAEARVARHLRSRVPVLVDADGVACVLLSWVGLRDRRRFCPGYRSEPGSLSLVVAPNEERFPAVDGNDESSSGGA